MKNIYVVINPEGKLLSETVRGTYDLCRNEFVINWTVPVIQDYMAGHVCWELWGYYEKAGFIIEEIELPTKQK